VFCCFRLTFIFTASLTFSLLIFNYDLYLSIYLIITWTNFLKNYSDLQRSSRITLLVDLFNIDIHILILALCSLISFYLFGCLQVKTTAVYLHVSCIGSKYLSCIKLYNKVASLECKLSLCLSKGNVDYFCLNLFRFATLFAHHLVGRSVQHRHPHPDPGLVLLDLLLPVRLPAGEDHRRVLARLLHRQQVLELHQIVQQSSKFRM
jgi:hypothetical protein